MSAPLKGRRQLMERNKKNAEDGMENKNLLFEKVKQRKRAYRIPYFLGNIKKYVKDVGGIRMGMRETRKFEVITLGNQMEVLCVEDTDPKANKAACAMSVNAGYFSDPDDMPGLAHLLEHMMFLGGNERFEPGEFAKFVDSVGGSENAYTVAEETNYHFDVPYSRKVFEDAIDRFTSSFVKPTFTKEGIKKEAEVVDNEHSKNIGDPMRSVVELLRANSNPAHPFVKFSCGNFETLNTIPEEKGLNIPQFLTDFFERHYSANRMKCVLIAPCSVDILKDIATKYFTKIENRDSKPLPFPAKPFTDNEHFTRFDMIANDDDNEILLSFPLENFSNLHKELTYAYISTALGKNSPGSLVDYLEEKGWAQSVSGFPMQCANDCLLYWVVISCTEEGIWDHVEDIIHAFFIFMSQLYHSGLSDAFINDVADSTAKNFANTLVKNPFSYAQKLASNMQQCEKEYFLTHGNVPFSFDHDTFLRFCECIVPEKMTVVVSHKGAEAVADQQESRLKARFAKAKMDPELLERFNERDPEVVLQIPKVEVEKELNNRRFVAFQKPACCGTAKLTNLPEALKGNPVLKGETQVFVYVNEPKDEATTTGKLEGVEDAPEPIESAQPKAGFSNMLSAGTRERPGMKDINEIKKATTSNFLSKGVINGGNLGGLGNIPAFNDKIKGVDDEKKTANEVRKGDFDFASTDIGRLQKMDCTSLFRDVSDQFRTPLLIKASNKSLLFFKQNVPTSMETLTTQVCVKVMIYPEFLDDYKCSPRDKALVNFYILFVNSSLSHYAKELQFEHNVEFSVYAARSAIMVSITGYNEKVFDVCRQVLDEMKRTHSFKWDRFQRYRNHLLSSKKEIERSPLSICQTVADFVLSEPRFLYTDMHEETKTIKLRDCKIFAEKMLQNCNLQVLVMGNTFPQAAMKMFDLLETSLKTSDGNKEIFTSFPDTKKVRLARGKEVFYVQKTSDIFKSNLYEYRTYHEDINSGFYCILQIGEMSFKNRAIIVLLKSLIDSPCREDIRTKERVGYLIHTNCNQGGLVGSVEFIFQSNVFGPYIMDEKLDRFLGGYIEMLKNYSDAEVIKAKKGIASDYLKPPVTVSAECDRWAGTIAAGSYDFEFIHKFIHELWKVTLEDIVSFYEEYVIPGAPGRRKIVIGTICGPHEEKDNLVREEKLKQENIEEVKDPYEFKYQQELVYRVDV